MGKNMIMKMLSMRKRRMMLMILSFVICHLSFSPAWAQTYTLQQLNDSARTHNNKLRAARHDIDAARQQRREAFTKYFPNISATGLWFTTNNGMAKMEVDPKDLLSTENASILKMIPEKFVTGVQNVAQAVLPAQVMTSLSAIGNPLSFTLLKNGAMAGVTAVQPVFAGGQIVNGNRLARVGEDVSRLKLQLSENEVDRTTTYYYWQLVTLYAKLRTVNTVEQMLAEFSKDASVAVKAGVALRNDLLQVQLRQNDVKSQKLTLQNAISVMKLTLAHHCGLRDTLFALATPSSDPVLMPAPAEGSLSSLPEYKLLEKQVEATRLQRKMEVGKNLPSLAVGAGYHFHNMLDKSLFDASRGKQNHSFGMLFATLSVPLSDWWGGAHAIKHRKIEQRKAEEQLDDTSQLLHIRMQNAWNGVQEAWQQMQLALQGIEQAQENLRLHRNFYKAGTCTVGDLLQAQLLYSQALDKHADAQANYHNRLLDYQQSIGEYRNM